MADNCSELSARISALEAAVAAIPRVNEESILQKAEATARSLFPLLVPGIAAPIALGFVAPLKSEVSKAIGLASAAESTAGNALSQAGSALGKIAGLAASLVALAASVATLLVIGGRIDSLERRVDSFDSALSRVYGFITGAQFLAERAMNQAMYATTHAEDAWRTAIRALQEAQSGRNEALTANGRLDKVEPKVALVAADLIDVEGRLGNVESSLTGVKLDVENVGNGVITAKRLATQAQNTANESITKADNALTISTNADRKATQADSHAANAQATAERAQGAASAAQNTATTADRKVGVLGGVLEGIATIADNALGISKATAAEMPSVRNKSDIAISTSKEAANKVNNLEGIIDGVNKEARSNTLDIQGLKTAQSGQGDILINVQKEQRLLQQQVDQQLQRQNEQQRQIDKLVNDPTPGGKDLLTKEQEKQLRDTALAVALLTPIIQQIGDKTSQIFQNTTASSLEAAARTGVCNSTAPGGCMSNALKQSGDDIFRKIDNKFQNGFDKLNSLLNSVMLAWLQKIDSKLGGFIPGGISGYLTKFRGAWDLFKSWNVQQKMVDYINLILTIQIAFQLTDGLGSILNQAINNARKVIFFQDVEGKDVDYRNALFTPIANIIDEMFGDGVTDAFKLELKAANKIFNSVSNLANMVQACFWSVFNAFNVIGSWNAQIGNALKKYGVVGHNAFGWMNAAPNFHNKVFTLLFEANNIVSQLDMISQTILGSRKLIDETGKQFGDLNKDLKEATGTVPPEHKPTADKDEASATANKAPTPPADVLGNLSNSF